MQRNRLFYSLMQTHGVCPCESLLLDSLKDHNSLTKQEIVNLLWDVLSDQLDDKQKMNKIDYLLKRLRTDGEIHNETKGNVSIWSLGKG